jgi:hypothetical protein
MTSHPYRIDHAGQPGSGGHPDMSQAPLFKGVSQVVQTEVLNRAGINKALLHYYFRTKERLFEAIFAHICEVIGKAIQAAQVKRKLRYPPVFIRLIKEAS